jgi:hypothetical protein
LSSYHYTEFKQRKIIIGDQGMPNMHIHKFMAAFHQVAEMFLWFDEERKEQKVDGQMAETDGDSSSEGGFYRQRY